MTGDKVTAETVSSLLGDRELIVASNRQPYSHVREDGDITVSRPAGGLTTALDPVMQSAGGTWVAWGSGDADFDVTDDDGRVRVPPESPAYDLRRVELDEERIEGYYYGYSNQVLWPICHIDPAKMNADAGFWNHYRQANRAFADAIADEATEESLVWFQDYHLGVAPRMVRESAVRTRSACSSGTFRGPRGTRFRRVRTTNNSSTGYWRTTYSASTRNDYCQNFLDCAAMLPGTRVDRATRSVVYEGRRTFVRPFPLGIDADGRQELAASGEATAFWREFRREYELGESGRGRRRTARLHEGDSRTISRIGAVLGPTPRVAWRVHVRPEGEREQDPNRRVPRVTSGGRKRSRPHQRPLRNRRVDAHRLPERTPAEGGIGGAVPRG